MNLSNIRKRFFIVGLTLLFLVGLGGQVNHVSATSEVKKYPLDVNSIINGQYYTNTNDLVIFDMYINDTLVSKNVKDFYWNYPSGTRYKIVPKYFKDGEMVYDGCLAYVVPWIYNGVSKGSLSGVVERDTEIIFNFTLQK